METLLAQPLVWVTAVVILCVGVLIGVALRPQRDMHRTKELEVKLQESQQELEQYRGQVTQHFVQTADLLQAMTANYRAVYEHLAAGAQTLCNGQVQTLSAAALSERLLPEKSPTKTTTELQPAPAPVPAEENAVVDNDQKTDIVKPQDSPDPTPVENMRANDQQNRLAESPIAPDPLPVEEVVANDQQKELAALTESSNSSPDETLESQPSTSTEESIAVPSSYKVTEQRDKV